MKLVAALGRDRDVPIGAEVVVAGAALGAGADVEVALTVLPDLSLSFAPSSVVGSQVIRGSLPRNEMQNRQITMVAQAAITAVVTNTYDWRLNLWRNGALMGALAFHTLSVATTVAAAITAPGVQAVTPAAMAGVHVGQQLIVDAGASREVITVMSLTGTTLTANFTKTHSASFALTSSLPQWLPVNMTPAWGGVVAGATLPAITAGANVVVTPNAVNGLSGMYGIHVGDQLLVDSGAPLETVTVSAVTPTTFTATFANSHSASAVFSTAKLGLATAPGAFAVIQPLDVLTIARVSAGTGLASQTAIFSADWTLASSSMGQ